MATISQTREVSTPSVLVSGVTIPIIPNSAEWGLGNGSTPRAVSNGGGSIALVNGIDASKLVCGVKFEVANTPEMIGICRAWINNANNGGQETIQIVDQASGSSWAFDQCYLKGDMNAGLKANGNITVAWDARYVA